MDTGYRNLNESVARQLSKALETDPGGDLEDVLRKLYTSYSRLRSTIDERRKKRAAKASGVTIPEQGQDTTSRAVQDSGLGRNCTLHRNGTYPSPISFLSTTIDPHTVQVVSPLAQDVISMIRTEQRYPGQHLGETLLGLLTSRSPISTSLRTSIVPLSATVMMKLNNGSCLEEMSMLQFLDDHIPSVHAPKFLGLVTIGSKSCMFMTRIPGETLEKRWPEMQEGQKREVLALINQMLIALRKFDLPVGKPFGSPSDPAICKDTRRSTRKSIPDSIYTESQFNDFIATSDKSRIATRFRNWVASMMRTNHRILLTHGDLHPRNIMVRTDLDGHLSVVVIDWEMGGYYPEYWEMLKALNTRSVDDSSDWWDLLPSCILGYDYEVVLDRFLERSLGLF
jgi:hypothetical protein